MGTGGGSRWSPRTARARAATPQPLPAARTPRRPAPRPGSRATSSSRSARPGRPPESARRTSTGSPARQRAGEILAVHAQAARGGPDERRDQDREGHQADAQDREAGVPNPRLATSAAAPVAARATARAGGPCARAHSGTGTVARASSTISSARGSPRRARRASGSGGATARRRPARARRRAARSRGPASMARAFAERSRARPARGLAPSWTRGSRRVTRGQAPRRTGRGPAPCGPGRRGPRGEDPVPVGHRDHPLDGIVGGQVEQHLGLVAGRRIADRHAAARSGRAGPRAAEGALVLHRVLGGDDHERQRSSRVSPSTVTCASSMHSRSADCVFGDARLISSTSSRLANTGPGRKTNAPRSGPRP